MVEETLSGAFQNTIRQGSKVKAGVSHTPAAVKKPVDRKQRLLIHLLIGCLMTGIVIFGYAIFSPGAVASAEETASYYLTDVARQNQAAGLQTGAAQAQPAATASDLASLNAEMEELTRRMEAMKSASHGPVSASEGNMNMTGGIQRSGMLTNSAGPAGDRVEQLMTTMHEMVAKMDRIMAQSPGASAPAAQSDSHH